MTLRAYQSAALDRVAHEHKTHRAVCLVMPTGAGKSVASREWCARQVAQGKRGLMVAHRIELLTQFAGHLSAVGVTASIIAPGYASNPYASVQCASFDTLLARGEVPDAQFILHDESHHGAAQTYRQVLDSLPDAVLLGPTATPQRGDGKPLGDIYGALVVGANYSELLRGGHLVPCRVFRPEKYLGSDQITESPADSWVRFSGGGRGFAFCGTVKESKELAAELVARGVRAANVDGAMSGKARAAILDRFRSGDLDVLTNVFVLTEGLDVPEAQVCMLAKAPQHAGTYLQMVGRVLRPAVGKAYAILIDRHGCSHEHGLPTADREYALEGRSISTAGESLRLCPSCGVTCRSLSRVCPECSFEFPRREYKGPKLWNLELLEYFENVGELDTAPKSLKQAEWGRLLDVAMGKRFGVSFAVQEYEKSFKARPSDAMMKDLGDEVRVAELKRLLGVQMTRGLKLGWISHAYKQTFGAFPSRGLREKAGVPVPEDSAWSR